MSDDATGRWLLLALFIPETHEDDPDGLADDLVRILNHEWPSSYDIEVAGIPGPQWLTPKTLKNLQVAASGRVITQDEQAVLDSIRAKAKYYADNPLALPVGTQHPLEVAYVDAVNAWLAAGL